jgi:hypothetical protein
MRSLYRDILGASWNDLDPAVQRVHLNVSPLARFAGTLSLSVKVPRTMAILLAVLGVRIRPVCDVAVRLVVIRHGETEIWRRYFGRRKVETTQSAGRGNLIVERMGPAELRFGLDVRGGALSYHFVSTHIRIWPLRVRLPDWLAPRGSATESANTDGVRVEVVIAWPIAGVTLSYAGIIKAAETMR